MGVLARELEALRDTLRSWAEAARRAWARRPTPPRAGAIAFAAAAALAGALSMVAQVRLPARLPSARDWAALRALLERDARPGDAVALSPAWAERAREIVPASLPVLARTRYAGEDLPGVRRIWIVSLPDAPAFSWAPELELLQRAARGGPTARVGAFEAAPYEVTFPLLPLAFLPDRLGTAKVSRGGEACAGDGAGGFVCGEGEARVAREVREIAAAPRPCLLAQAGGGVPLEIAFPGVIVGRAVRGHLGAPGRAALASPVRVSVTVDGEDAGAAELAGAGFLPFQADTSRFAGAARDVSLVLTAPGSTEVCLDAVTVP